MLEKDHSRYNLRPNGKLDVHAGLMKNRTFNSPDEALIALDRRETFTSKVSEGLRTLSVPVVLFSSLETGLGLKQKNAARAIRGLAGVGLGLGSRLCADKLENLSAEIGLEKERLEDALQSAT